MNLSKISGLEKLAGFFRGGIEVAKYATIGIALLGGVSGCSHIPKPISVSSNGEAVALPVNKEGEMRLGREDYSDIVLINPKNKENPVRYFEGGIRPIWVTNSNQGGIERIAIALNDQKTSKVVIINPDGKRVSIENASYPCLSPDGNYLVYAKPCGDIEKNQSKGKFYLRNFKTGVDIDLGIDGIVPDISPDSMHLSYIRVVTYKNVNSDTERKEFFLNVCNINGNNVKSVSRIQPGQNESFPFYQSFIDNSHVLFQTKPDGNDYTQIFIGGIDQGNLEQVTNNSFEVLFPKSDTRGRVFYIGPENPSSDERNVETKSSVYVAQKNKEGSWVSKTIPIHAIFFAVTKDNSLVYVSKIEGRDNNYGIFRVNLDRPGKPENLSDIFRNDLSGKLRRHYIPSRN